MATVQAMNGTTFLLEGVSWESYESLLRDLRDRPVRLTYDRGALEFMSPSLAHERYGRFLGRLLQVWTEENNIPILTGGSTTFREFAQQQGLEPDECFWIEHESAMRGKLEFDAQTDPPPDLAIEIDITRSSLDRLAIYAGLVVPEVWRFEDETLTALLLTQDQEYVPSTSSRAFPLLPLPDVLRFLLLAAVQDETTLIRDFRRWVRGQIRASGGSKKKPRGKRKS